MCVLSNRNGIFGIFGIFATQSSKESSTITIDNGGKSVSFSSSPYLIWRTWEDE